MVTYVYPTFAGIGEKESVERLKYVIAIYYGLRTRGNEETYLVIHPHIKEYPEAYNILGEMFKGKS